MTHQRNLPSSAMRRPTGVSGRAAAGDAVIQNKLFFGDNLDSLRRHIPGEPVDLMSHRYGLPGSGFSAGFRIPD
ncbi:MAG: hypothetical protein ACLQVD_02610 [Capsulimonadaceae bacterium]